MNCRTLFRTLLGSKSRRLASSSYRHSPMSQQSERLETRTVPTGNVTAVLAGRSLYLYGDEAGNSVELTASGSNLILRGLNNTTVNGQTSDFLVRTGSLEVRQSLFAYLGGGDDTLAISAAARIRRDAFVYMGEGNDTFAMHAGEAHRNLYVDLGGGTDNVSFDNALATRGVSITGGPGDKLISINNSRIADFFNVVTSTGNDQIVIDSSSLGDDVYFHTSLGNDTVLIDNSSLRDYATIDTSLGDDFVQISPTTRIGDDTNLFLGLGDDNVVVEGGNTFSDNVHVFGQSGTDNVEVATGNTFAQGIDPFDTDGAAVDDALQTARISDSATGAASRAAAVRAAVTTAIAPRVIQLTLDKTTVSESAGANAITGTVNRPTGAIGDIVVTLANDSTAALAVPTSVTIPSGATSKTFTINVTDNSTQGSDKTATVTASSAGFTNSTASVVITDDDAPLTVEITETSVAEGKGANALTGTVTRTTSTGSATVNFASSDTSELTVPASVIIEDGKTSATFAIASVEDDVLDGTRSVTITASGTGFVTATDTVSVTDNETGTPTLTLSLDKSTVSEADGAVAATATVSRNTEPTDELVIDVSSDNTTIAKVGDSVTIPAGKTSVSFPISVEDDQFDTGTREVTITVEATSFTNGTAKLSVTDNDIALELDTSANTVVDDGGTLITKKSSFTVAGTTEANATVALDVDDDGFDDGTQTAGTDGKFSFIVPLTHTDANNGRNSLKFRATAGTDTSGTIEELDVHLAVGSVAELRSNLGTMYVELLDTDAPLAVQNFKNYFSRYTNAFAQRSPENFVIQAGGFTVTNGVVSTITTDAPIQNEFDLADNSNLPGTLSMALPGGSAGLNQGTSQWFINVTDNSRLDANKHTVFGRLIGDGLDIAQAINALDTVNLNAQHNQSALGEVPVIGDLDFEDLTGTVSVAAGSRTVTGTGTSFFAQLDAASSGVNGSTIRIGSQTFTVASITSNTELTLDVAATNAATNVVAQRHADPDQLKYVVFSSIGEVLNS